MESKLPPPSPGGADDRQPFPYAPSAFPQPFAAAGGFSMAHAHAHSAQPPRLELRELGGASNQQQAQPQPQPQVALPWGGAAQQAAPTLPQAPVRPRHTPFTPPAAATPTSAWHPAAHNNRYNSPLYGKSRKRVASNTSSIMTDDAGFGAEAAKALEDAASAAPGSFWETEDSLLDDTKSEDGLPAVDDVSSVFSDRQSVSSSTQFASNGGSLQQMTSTFANVQRPTTPSGLLSGAQPPTTPSSLYSGVQPPTTPSSVVSGYDSSDEGRFRTGGVTYTPLGNPKSRSNSSENLFARNYSPPPYDESKSGPMSCPPAFNASGKQPFAGSARGSLNGYPVQRSTELIASKLLPTKNSVNSLMGYVRELQLSEATLRDQLVKTKKTSEIEISKSKSKMSTLEKSIHEIEAEKEEAKRKLQEQERLIQQLSAKLREVEQQQKQQQQAGGLAIPPPIPEDSPLPEPVVAATYTTVEESTTVVEGPHESENVSTTVTTEVTRSSETVQFEATITSEVIETHDTAERAVTEYTSIEDTSAEVTQSYEVSSTQDVPSLPPLQTEEQMQPAPTAPSGVMSPLSPTPLPWNPWGSGGEGSIAPPAFSVAPSAGIDLVSPSTQPPVAQETYSEQVTEVPQAATIEPAPVEHDATQLEQQHDSASYEDTSIASADAPQQEMYASAPFMSPTQYSVDGGSSSYPTSPMNPSFPAPVFSMGAVPPMEELYTPQHAQQTQETAYPASDQVAAEQHADHDQYAEQNGYAEYPQTEAYAQDQYAQYQQSGTAADYQQHGFAEQYQQSTEEYQQSADEYQHEYQQSTEQYQQSSEERQQSAEEYQHEFVEQSRYYSEDVVAADGSALHAPPASSFAETSVETQVAPPVELPNAPPAEPLPQPTEQMDASPTESLSEPPTGPPLNGPPGGLPPAPPLCAPPTGPSIGAPPSPAGSQPPVESAPSTDAPVKDAAYLESLLTDFFTEFDKKKLKMAQVYAKRYFGREDVLFKELTRRYGKGKVSTLQSRYDGASADAPKVNTTPAPKSPAASTKHPHHQFFQSHGSHADAPSANVENHSHSVPEASPPAAEYSAENGPPMVAPPMVQDSFVESVVPGEDVSAEEPHPSQESDVSQSLSTPPPPQTDGQSNAVRNGPPMFNYPPPAEKPKPARVSPRMQRRNIPPFGAPPSSMPPLPQPPIVGEPQPSQKMPEANGSTPPPISARPSPQAPGAAASSSQSAAAPPAEPVTLESLLMELYRKHQPDKIKNVSVVAREYAGKERELIRLLKGKYGALAVKRLEENLPALEISSRRAVARKGGRGCFACTIVILTGLFWTAILSVIAGVYIIDSYECQALSGEDIDTAVSDGECSTLTSELKEFSHSKIGKYSHQSHSEACFCAEWKQREASLSSFESAVELAKLVPFSPGHFGGSLIEVVKDQLPLYDYASPIVQVMVDAGSMVWSESSSISGSASSAKKAGTMDNSAISKNQVHSSDSVLTKVALASKSLANPQEYEASNEVEVLEDAPSETESETESESEPQFVEAGDYKDSDEDSPAEEFVEVVVEQEGLDLSVASIDETEIDSQTAPIDEEEQNPTELAEVETDLNVAEEEFASTAEEPVLEEVLEEVVAEVTDSKQSDEVEEPKDENDIASTNDDGASIESEIVTEDISVDNEIESDASTTEDSELSVVEDDAAADELQDTSSQEVVGEIAESIAEIVTLDVEVDSEQSEIDETLGNPEIEADAAVDVIEVDAAVGIEEVDGAVDVDELGSTAATAEAEETTAEVQVEEVVAELEVEEFNVPVTDSTSEDAATTEESDEPVTRHEEVTHGLEEEAVVDISVADADSSESVVEVEVPGVASIEEVANEIEVISPAHESAMDESDQTTDVEEVIVDEPAADVIDEYVISQVDGEEAVVGVAKSEVDGNAKDDDLLDSTDAISDVTESAAIEDAVGEAVEDAAEASERAVDVDVEEASEEAVDADAEESSEEAVDADVEESSEEAVEEAKTSINPADVVDALYSEQDPASAVAEADQAALDQLESS